ncbi:hypothetical protein RIF29_15186 [Crotalaria pallida]|uniref:NADH dehydrogenase [ubiquinone] 1 alpha subcomplex subunit 13 n=1 Tax=Crotalaria pallida TaxID=3830 RepID=A0AAN9FD21_CROPI
MTEAYIRKKPRMASVKDMPVFQDGPPPAGFAPVQFARRIPNTGPSAAAIFLTTFGLFSWGMYQVGKGNKIRRFWCFPFGATSLPSSMADLCSTHQRRSKSSAAISGAVASVLISAPAQDFTDALFGTAAAKL